MYLRCFDIAVQYCLFDTVDGILETFSDGPLEEKGDEFPLSGMYVDDAQGVIAIYRDKDVLFFRYGDKVIPVRSSVTARIRWRGLRKRVFCLSDGGRKLIEHTYRTPNDRPPILLDFTTWTKEDGDFFLFVARLLSDAQRREEIYLAR